MKLSRVSFPLKLRKTSYLQEEEEEKEKEVAAMKQIMKQIIFRVESRCHNICEVRTIQKSRFLEQLDDNIPNNSQIATSILHGWPSRTILCCIINYNQI